MEECARKGETVVDGDADGELDPRIQIELENLNKSTDEINKLEIELDVSFLFVSLFHCFCFVM